MLIVDTSLTEANASACPTRALSGEFPKVFSPAVYRVLRLCPVFVTRRRRTPVQRFRGCADRRRPRRQIRLWVRRVPSDRQVWRGAASISAKRSTCCMPVRVLMAQDLGHRRQPVDLHPGLKADREAPFGGLRRAPRGFPRSIDLSDRDSGVVQIGAAGRRHYDTGDTAREQRDAHPGRGFRQPDARWITGDTVQVDGGSKL